MDFDVIVVGGGLVGASLALALKATGLKLAVVDTQRARNAAADPAEWDSRVYAISPGSAAFLDACGAWRGIDAARVCQVEDMHVVGDDLLSAIDFSAYKAGLRELAIIVENRELQRALWARAATRAGIEVIAPAVCGN